LSGYPCPFRIYLRFSHSFCSAGATITPTSPDLRRRRPTTVRGSPDLEVDEAIAYAQRGRGERKRPTSGWASLTPAERAVVQLVSEGLANKDIATRLFVSPRTVQTHLTHVYTKLGLTSRVQLVQEAARRA
jgi:DNA-binding CsgD family transcriptional regulator